MNATIYHAEHDHAAIFTEDGGEGQRDLAILVRHRSATDADWSALMMLIDQADIIRDAARDVVAAAGSRRQTEAVNRLACILGGATEIEIRGAR